MQRNQQGLRLLVKPTSPCECVAALRTHASSAASSAASSTKLELKAHQAQDVFAEYDNYFAAQKKTKADQARVGEESKAKSEADEVKT